MRFKKTLLGVALVLAGILSTEIIARVLGISDVPIRDPNPVTGYIPLPNQSGSFMNNSWHINEMQMISRNEFTTDGDEILIAGDSIVFGGNKLDQSERVGERLEAMLDARNVYTIADGGWSFKNPVNYLEARKDELSKVKDIVLVLNSDDFDRPPASWRCMSNHPTETPLSASYFAFRKYVFARQPDPTPDDLVVADFDVDSKLNGLLDDFKDTRFTILLYQNSSEWRSRQSLRELLGDGVSDRIEVYELTDFPDLWDQKFYTDALHPDAEGASALARIIERILVERDAGGVP